MRRRAKHPPGAAAPRQAPRGRACALAVLLLACRPPAPARSLADRLAPEPPWPGVQVALESLLRHPEAPVAVPFGEENLRCSLQQGPGSVALDCDQIRHEAASLDELLRDINGGSIHRALSRRRLAEPERFKEVTRISLQAPWTPDGDRGQVVLEEPFAQALFTVGKHGEIRAELEGLDEPVTFEAASLWALGNRLRQARAELSEARAAQRIDLALAQLMAPLRLLPTAEAGYGAATLGAPPPPSLPDDERHKRAVRGGLLLDSEPIAVDGRVHRVTRTFRFDPPDPDLRDCERVLRALQRHVPSFFIDPRAHGCDWRATPPGLEIQVTTGRSALHLSVSLSLGRRLALPPAPRP